MKKRDLYVIGGALVLALALFLLFQTGILNRQVPLGEAQRARGDVSVLMLPRPAGEGEGMELPLMSPDSLRQPGEAYLKVIVGRSAYEPVPMSGRYELRITQDGGQENIAWIEDGVVHMNSANCKNQRCIHQGEVSLDNRDFRAFGGQIICAPNQVVLEVLSSREAAAMFGETP